MSTDTHQKKKKVKSDLALVYAAHDIQSQRTVCAWCLSERGIERGDGSHGICEKHAAILLQQWRERKTH